MSYDPALDEHHDQRYEDGDYSTGTVADYADSWYDDEANTVRADDEPRIQGLAVYLVGAELPHARGDLVNVRRIHAERAVAAIQTYRRITGTPPFRTVIATRQEGAPC